MGSEANFASHYYDLTPPNHNTNKTEEYKDPAARFVMSMLGTNGLNAGRAFRFLGGKMAQFGDRIDDHCAAMHDY